jgi:hypothetical protein
LDKFCSDCIKINERGLPVLNKYNIMRNESRTKTQFPGEKKDRLEHQDLDLHSQKAVWEQAVSKRHDAYLALRPDAFSDYPLKSRFKDQAEEDTPEYMWYWYERAVDEQKKEQREYKKKTKALPPQIEPIPLAVEDIEEDLPQGQGDRQEPIKA